MLRHCGEQIDAEAPPPEVNWQFLYHDKYRGMPSLFLVKFTDTLQKYKKRDMSFPDCSASFLDFVLYEYASTFSLGNYKSTYYALCQNRVVKWFN